ncbi:MAG: HIT family protein [Patescibacteria group bacterium]
MPTLFTQIISGELSSHKIWEDNYTFAFLDIYPVSAGHVLIVPKIEVDYFVDVPEPYYTKVFQTAKKISPAIQQVTISRRIAMLVQGDEVPHFHLHLIPIYNDQTLLGAKSKASQEQLKDTQQQIIKHFSVHLDIQE